MEDSKRQLIEETKQFWQARYRKKLSDEDAREIIENMTRFFKILIEWDQKAKDQADRSGEKGTVR